MLLDVLQLEAGSTKAKAASGFRKRLEIEIAGSGFDIYDLVPASTIGERDLNSWFTSLWTLQEAWLRPDMHLKTLDWESVVLCSGWEPELLSIIAIIRHWTIECFKIVRQGAEITSHSGARLLPYIGINGGPLLAAKNWLEVTSLTSLLDPTPLQILALGDKRQCTSRRAEAIMSAIGVTQWFRQMPYERHEEDLVLGRYPLPFLEEVRAVNPHSFFCSATKLRGTVGLTILYTDKAARRELAHAMQETSAPEFRHIDPTRIGSLLPFDQYGDVSSFDKVVDGHVGQESVSSWRIEISGHVRIRRACVLTSNRLAGVPFIRTELNFLPTGLRTKMPAGEVTAYEWTNTRPFEVHIVVVKHHSHTPNDLVMFDELITLNCIIIARDDIGRLVCIGRCNVELVIGEQYSLPQAREVDWRVA